MPPHPPDNSNEGKESDWIIGVVLMVVGSVLNNLGNNLMSLGHTEQRNIDKIKRRRSEDIDESSDLTDFEAIEKKGTWRFKGSVIFVIGALIVFISFGFAAQSLLAALESVQFISNVVFHKYVHGENITNRLICATACIVFGNILVVIFANHSSLRLNNSQIQHVYVTNIGFHAYMGISGLIFIISFLVYWKYSVARSKGMQLWKHPVVEPLCFIIFTCLIGTQSVLHAKCLSMLMQLCINGENQFATKDRHIVSLELVVWVISAVLFVNRIDKGLNLYPPVFFIPVQAVAFAFFTIVCGGIFFSEFDHFSVKQIICFAFGVLLIFIGVCALTPSDAVIRPELCHQYDDLEINSTTLKKCKKDESLNIENTVPMTMPCVIRWPKASRREQDVSAVYVDDQSLTTMDSGSLVPYYPQNPRSSCESLSSVRTGDIYNQHMEDSEETNYTEVVKDLNLIGSNKDLDNIESLESMDNNENVRKQSSNNRPSPMKVSELTTFED
jgi:hypothetical protein